MKQYPPSTNVYGTPVLVASNAAVPKVEATEVEPFKIEPIDTAASAPINNILNSDHNPSYKHYEIRWYRVE